VSDRILIIEDEQTVADIIAINLRIETFEVDVALNGTSGLARARESDIDLIICDIMMPDVDGYQICRELKGDPATRGIPIILLTARTEVENKVAGLEAGADDFITKPFNFNELVDHINMNLDRAANKYITDSLTGLPGNIDSDDMLKAKAVSGEPFAYMLVSINDLRPYREVYGDKRFEGVLRFASRVISSVINGHNSSGNTAYYLGGGTFSVLADPQAVEHFARDILDEFDIGIRDFYSREDVIKGCVSSFDRRGALVDNPLMTISIGIASNGHREIRSHWEAAEIAREVLEYAVTFPASKYVMDRRAKSGPGKK
jgi:PleD family two-component response regulator